jgi:hypothetical protein
MYYDELLSKSKNKTKTTCKGIGNNNCQNDIKSQEINNIITNTPQKTANTFNDYFLAVADTVIENIKKNYNDPTDNANPSSYYMI